VDVRDVALAHILSLETPKAANQRILLVSELITPQLVVNITRKHFPQLNHKIMEGNPSQILPKGVNPTGWDTSKSFEIFGDGWGYRGLEEKLGGYCEIHFGSRKAVGNAGFCIRLRNYGLVLRYSKRELLSLTYVSPTR
jgi:hypothetical protein